MRITPWPDAIIRTGSIYVRNSHALEAQFGVCAGYTSLRNSHDPKARSLTMTAQEGEAILEHGSDRLIRPGSRGIEV